MCCTDLQYLQRKTGGTCMVDFFTKGFKTKKAIMAIILLLSGCIISIGINYGNTGVFTLIHKKVPIYSVAREDKKISLTFDMSWGQDYTLKILEILDQHKIKATFFLVGGWIDDNKELVKEIVKRGHELGNHSNKHPDMTTISEEKIIQELMNCDAKIMAVTGQGTKLFRAPSGAYNDLLVATAEKAGYQVVQWDVDSIDWKENGPSVEYDRVIKNTKSGSILLFHNTAKYTPETLPKIIKELQMDGYEFVKVSELIYKDNYYINPLGRQIKK
jgi:polysaccharide deacetylase family sporulation protein PdaB